jgi:ABC-type transport system substrate-binding protein
MRFTIIALTILGFVMVPVRSGSAQEPDYSINTAFVFDEPDTLDPHVANEPDELEVLSLLCEGLINFEGDDMIPIPQLATSWEVSEDGISLVFTLRDDAYFPIIDRPMTADDVAYSFNRLIEFEATPMAAGLGEIVTEISVLDDTTLLIELAYPIALSSLGLPGVYIVPREAEEMGYDLSENPLCVGSYMLDTWEHGEAVTIMRNDDYYGVAPPFDAIRFRVIPDTDAQFELFAEGTLHIMYVNEEDLWRVEQDPYLSEQLRSADSFGDFIANLEEQGVMLTNSEISVLSSTEISMLDSVYPEVRHYLIASEIELDMQQPAADDSWWLFCIFVRWC